MANGDRFFGNISCQGEVTGTGADISIPLAYTPSTIQITNVTNDVTMEWNNTMPAGHGYKTVGGGSGSHSHALGSATSTINVSATNRLYTGVVTGTLQVGEVVNQATSAAHAVIVATNPGLGYIDVNTVTPTFDITHLCTGSISGATFTPVGATNPLLDLFTVPSAYSIIQAAQSNSGTRLSVVPAGGVLATGGLRLMLAGTTVETLHSDGYTSVLLTSLGAVTGSTTISNGSGTYVTTGGITSGNSGFTIGNDADLNQGGSTLLYTAWRI